MRARAAKWPRACRGLAGMALLRRRRRRERTRVAEGRTHGGEHDRGRRSQQTECTRERCLTSQMQRAPRQDREDGAEAMPKRAMTRRAGNTEANTKRERRTQRANEQEQRRTDKSEAD